MAKYRKRNITPNRQQSQAQDGGPIVIATGNRNPIEIASGKPDPNSYPRINTCCPCMDCLDSCIRKIESGGEGNPTDNPDDMGCNSRATDCGNCDVNGNPYIGPPSPPNPRRKPQRVTPGGMFDSDCDGVDDCFPGDPCDQFTSPAQGTNDSCDCGPYQISWRGYISDICGEVGPCSNGDGGYDNSCCEVCADGYGESLCKVCADGDEECCAEKTRRSLKLIDCWRRRYTRNPACNGSGDTDHPTDNDSGNCFTCQDIARMHNGGPCGHKRSWTEDYWNKIKACMERNCGYSAVGNSETCSNPVKCTDDSDCESFPSRLGYHPCCSDGVCSQCIGQERSTNPNNNCGDDTLTGSCCFIKDNIPTCKDGITCSLCNSEYDGCWSENSCEDRTMNEELLCCHDCKKRSECKLNHPNKQKFSTYLKSRSGIIKFRSRVDGGSMTSPHGPRGACCLPAGGPECYDLSENACLIQGGVWSGANISCGEIEPYWFLECPTIHEPTEGTACFSQDPQFQQHDRPIAGDVGDCCLLTGCMYDDTPENGGTCTDSVEYPPVSCGMAGGKRSRFWEKKSCAYLGTKNGYNTRGWKINCSIGGEYNDTYCVCRSCTSAVPDGTDISLECGEQPGECSGENMCQVAVNAMHAAGYPSTIFAGKESCTGLCSDPPCQWSSF